MRLTPSSYLDKLSAALSSLDVASFDAAIDAIRAAWEAGAQIITLGNGGSAMTALHYITDWNKNIPLATGKPFRGCSLVDNMGLVMAWANDTSFEEVFERQLSTAMKPGDVVVAVSGSGNSPNVLRAVEWANANGGVTVGLCGYGGGRLKELARHVVWANVNDMQIAEDIHFIFGHMVLRALGDYKARSAQGRDA